jgi:hypothetical protein
MSGTVLYIKSPLCMYRIYKHKPQIKICCCYTHPTKVDNVITFI